MTAALFEPFGGSAGDMVCVMTRSAGKPNRISQTAKGLEVGKAYCLQFVTADLKYHQFFDARGRILMIDAGHFETEQFTTSIIANYLKEIFPNFAVHISKVADNPVNYL